MPMDGHGRGHIFIHGQTMGGGEAECRRSLWAMKVPEVEV
jgi:hypothetical protein